MHLWQAIPASPDELAWDEWHMSDKEVEKIDFHNAVSLEEAHEMEEKTTEEMAVNG